MHADPPRHANANRRNFLVADPDSRVRWVAPRIHAKLGKAPNQRLFNIAQEAVQIAPVRPHIKNRVAHQLTGIVAGHIAPTVSATHLNPALGVEFGAEEQILGAEPFAQRNHGRMLQQKKRVGDGVCLALRVELLLNLPRLRVGNHSQVQYPSPTHDLLGARTLDCLLNHGAHCRYRQNAL
ncbi:hypothetical protein HRbin14_02013 [bacterium HR14]|nr:hypothetical protein HRbin14_02013 [bacterium HR14]